MQAIGASLPWFSDQFLFPSLLRIWSLQFCWCWHNLCLQRQSASSRQVLSWSTDEGTFQSVDMDQENIPPKDQQHTTPGKELIPKKRSGKANWQFLRHLPQINQVMLVLGLRKKKLAWISAQESGMQEWPVEEILILSEIKWWSSIWCRWYGLKISVVILRYLFYSCSRFFKNLRSSNWEKCSIRLELWVPNSMINALKAPFISMISMSRIHLSVLNIQ